MNRRKGKGHTRAAAGQLNEMNVFIAVIVGMNQKINGRSF